MPAPSDTSTLRALDTQAVARSLRRLAAAPGAPWLHGEVARRMAERLPIVKLQPEQVLDWCSHLGAGAPLLRQRYGQAVIHRMEPTAALRERSVQAAAVPWWSPRRWAGAPPPVLTADEVPAGAFQLVWANMMLHAAADPQWLMRQWHAALAPQGFLMFSTLGPGSLRGLRELYRAQHFGPAHAPFVDMHDLGDMLLHAGFADPVMDQEILTLHWADADALLAELRSLGANADPQRTAGLRTPRWRARLVAALEGLRRADGRLALEFEVVYGHAFKPLPRATGAARTEVPLDRMRALLRGRRRGADEPDGGNPLG